MTIERPSYQMSFELDLTPGPSPEGGGETNLNAGWVSPAEAAAREMEARRLFEGSERPGWYEEYEALIYGGWPFRVAMYIAWAATPKKERWPHSVEELASLMGLNTPRAIYTWRQRNPEIDRQVISMQAAPLFKHRSDAIRALVDSASDPDYRHAPDRRTFFTMTGDLDESVNVKLAGSRNDLSQMSDGELAELAAALNISPTSPPAPLPQGEGGLTPTEEDNE